MSLEFQCLKGFSIGQLIKEVVVSKMETTTGHGVFFGKGGGKNE